MLFNQFEIAHTKGVICVNFRVKFIFSGLNRFANVFFEWFNFITKLIMIILQSSKVTFIICNIFTLIGKLLIAVLNFRIKCSSGLLIYSLRASKLFPEFA